MDNHKSNPTVVGIFSCQKLVLPRPEKPVEAVLFCSAHYEVVELVREADRWSEGRVRRRRQGVRTPGHGSRVHGYEGIRHADVDPAHEGTGDDACSATNDALLRLHAFVGECLAAVGPPQAEVGRGVHPLLDGTGERGLR